MAKNIIEFSSATADIVSYANYTSSKTVLGPHIRQFTGSVASEYWIGPPPTRFQDPTQDTGLNNWGDIDALTYSGSKQWVFALRGFATIVANAEIAAYEFDSNTYTYTYKGRTSWVPPNPTAGTWLGINSNLEYYSTGSVSVSGTVVSGSGTDWIANRIPVGARIGFGSTNPADISTWYRIASYPSMSNKTGSNAQIYATAVDSSGSIYLGGDFTSYSGSSINRIVKLTPSGSIDTSFNPGVGFNSSVYSIKIDSAGKLYVGGFFTAYSGSTANYIIKLNPNGTKDTSFDNTTGFNGGVYDIQFDSTGSLWVGGSFTTWKGASTPCLAKLLTDGTRDTTYITTNSPNTTLYTVAVDNNDDVYIAGSFTQVGAVANNSRYIAKILKTGGLDPTFVVGTAGASNAFNGQVYDIKYKSSTNTIIASGPFTIWKGVSNTYLTELSSTGDVILSSKSLDTVYSRMVIDGSGSIYTTAPSTVSKRDIITLNTTSTFNPNTAFGTLVVVATTPFINPQNTTLYVPSNNFTIDAGLVAVDTTYGNHDLTFHTTPNYTSSIITLNSSAGTLPAGTPYVIENLQITCTNNANGPMLLQGIAWDDFTLAGTSVIAPTADYAALNKGNYGLTDAGYSPTTGWRTATYLSVGSCNDTLIIPLTSNNIKNVYFKNTSAQFSRLNIKDSRLRIHGSATAVGRIRFSTPNQITLVAAPTSPSINGWASGKFTIATMQSGTKSGSLSIYTDTSGIGQIDINTIENLTSPAATIMSEQPPGSTTTYTAAGQVGRVYYMPTIDKLIVLNSSATAKSYITDYITDLQQPTLASTLYGRDTYNALALQNSYNLTFLGNFGQLQGNTANINAPRYPDTLGTGFFGSVENGVLHLCRPLASIQNNMYAVPMGCEAEFVDFSKNAMYTPKYTLTNVVSISGLYVNTLKQYGADPFVLPPESIFIHYRTTGIDDDSGSWNLYTTIDALNADLECEGVLNNLEIQFRFSYKVAGNTCLPNRIYGFTLVYEDDRTDSHYTPSVAESDLTTRIFAWRQAESWYGNIPELKIRLYNAANNKIVYYDTTATNASGTWQYSTDGTTWFAWNATADAVGNYIRYVADFIPSGIKLRVGLNKI